MIYLAYLLIILPLIQTHPSNQLYSEAQVSSLLKRLNLNGDVTDEYCRLTQTCELIAFGNSLSDDGWNLIKGDKHGFTRYSNGPVWVDYLAKYFNFPEDNFINWAYSGGESGYNNYYFEGWSGQLWQIDRYLLEMEYPIVSKTTLFAVEVAGLNDIFKVMGNQTATLETQKIAVQNAIIALKKLAKRGALRIIVLEFLDVSGGPYFTAEGNEEIRAGFSKSVKEMNQDLDEKIAEFRAQNPQIRLAHVKFGEKFFEDEVMPEFFVSIIPFTHHKEDTTPFEPIDYIWFDSTHFNTGVHEIIAKKAYDQWLKTV